MFLLVYSPHMNLHYYVQYGWNSIIKAIQTNYIHQYRLMCSAMQTKKCIDRTNSMATKSHLRKYARVILDHSPQTDEHSKKNL